uniref:AP complex mu/sigma subunit domain-containing protein n=1 Tax=Chromera velia CCMP2878 TaxID=1169474 RepID=A0A0G4HJB0_9ALVE|mmetsp:Transcript_47555/g.93843  ORF Transcript_47555/g.93843 Transcript_47555/m.93843 type:complete len:201 (+) Transcript_47555:140-742(+)|eukprot:Cvel_7054.t1-p1 / transcript=Cvel_7054.t1 / gene=Cvel_7054 / organism=Chromera_velia_CCMP2878 / gene_product=hypothetical protein / transcript_product=hypothetical protein / location=Cvel_scaffold360:66043-69362(+) / protein_length=200 / sequence_SO=supercontig / SO=protein_coding / is_pseudo=false
MVYGILIHSAENSQKLFLSNFYTPEGNDAQKKARQQAVMRRILDEHFFQIQCASDSSRPPVRSHGHLEEWSPRFQERRHSQQAADITEGIVRFPASPLFRVGKVAVWKQVENIVFIVICDSLENLALANNFLILLINTVFENLKSFGVSGGCLETELMHRPDELLAILHSLLPAGILTFSNLAHAKFSVSQAQELLSQKP